MIELDNNLPKFTNESESTRHRQSEIERWDSERDRSIGLLGFVLEDWNER